MKKWNEHKKAHSNYLLVTGEGKFRGEENEPGIKRGTI